MYIRLTERTDCIKGTIETLNENLKFVLVVEMKQSILNSRLVVEILHNDALKCTKSAQFLENTQVKLKIISSIPLRYIELFESQISLLWPSLLF